MPTRITGPPISCLVPSVYKDLDVARYPFALRPASHIVQQLPLVRFGGWCFVAQYRRHFVCCEVVDEHRSSILTPPSVFRCAVLPWLTDKTVELRRGTARPSFACKQHRTLAISLKGSLVAGVLLAGCPSLRG